MADRKARRVRRRAGDAAATAAPAKTMPAWLPAAVYGAVTILLFREFFFSGGLLLGSDTFALSYFARDYYTTSVRTLGRFPLWDPLLFGGMPFVDGMHGDIFYPPSLALFFLDTRAMWGWKMVLHVFGAGILTFLWLRGIGLGRAAAFFGGLVYMMGADLVSLVYPGGDGKLFVSALAPLVFLLAERCIRRRGIAEFAAFALGLALVVFTSHMQLAYFTVWGVSLYFIFRVVQVWRTERQGRVAARLIGTYAVAGLLGVGAAAVQFLPPLGYLRDWSHRAQKTVEAEAVAGYAYSTTWSLHPEEAVSLVVPEFVGDNVPTRIRSGTRYWGRNAFKINHEYAGLVPLLLLPFVFVRRRSARTWFFAGLAVLSLLYGLGATTPAFRIFYLIPGVRLFRAPSLIIFLYGLSVATLGAIGLQRMLDWTREPPAGAVPARRALWVVASVFLLLALAQSAGAVTNVWQSLTEVGPDRLASLQENLPEIGKGFWIAAAVAIVVAALWEAVSRGLLGTREAVIAVSVLAFIDLYRVDRPFINGTVLAGQARTTADPTVFTPDESIRFLQQAQAGGEVFRVYDLGLLGLGGGSAYGYNTLATHGIEQLTGHHGNEIGRYRDLMGGSDSAPNVAVSRLHLLNLANVRYVVSPQLIEFPGYEEAFVGSRSAIYRNLDALPRAYLAGTVEIVPDEQVVERLLAEGFDAANTVLLPEPLPADVVVEAGVQGQAEWAEREPDRYTLRVEADRPALLVISENYYPAWNAEVDGAAVPVLRANYTFRAVPVPAGSHEVHLFYESVPLRRSAMASAGVLILLLVLAGAGMLRRQTRVEAG